MILRVVATLCLAGLWLGAAFGYGRNSADRDPANGWLATVASVVVLAGLWL